MKRGDRLAFFGAIYVQSILPFNTEEEVSQEYLVSKKILEKNGGWICAPTHHVQLDTPMKNFFALLEAADVDYSEPKTLNKI